MTNDDSRFTIKTQSPTEVTVEVTVAASEVQEGISAVYRRYAREVQVPGFRRGHVPRAFLETRLGKSLFEEEAQKDLEEKHLPEALANLALRPVTPPQVKTIAFSEKEPFVFEATFSVLPKFEPPAYRGIELSIPPEEKATDEDVRSALEEIRRHYATLAPKTGDTVALGDIVHVREKDEEWDAQTDEENPVTARLVGHNVGEAVKVDLPLPEGKTISTELEILSLKQVVLPEMDDALAKSAGHESLGALEADVRQRLEAARHRRHEQATRLGLLDRLLEKVEIALPAALVERIAEEELEGLKKNLADSRSPLSFEEYLKRRDKSEDQVRSDYRQLVTRRLRRELLLRKIAEKQGIRIDDAELEREATSDAEESGEAPMRFVARLKAEDRWDDYRTEKENARVLDLLRAEAKLTEETK